jgi:hypothetical protein
LPALQRKENKNKKYLFRCFCWRTQGEVRYNLAAGEDRNENSEIEVIDDFLQANCSQAIRRKPLLTFRECIERWKDAAKKWRNNGQSAVASSRKDGNNNGNGEPGAAKAICSNCKTDDQGAGSMPA